MRRNVVNAMIAVFCILACVLDVETVLAQGTATKPAEKTTADMAEVVTLKKMTGLGAQCVVKTPEYRTSATRGLKPPGDWIQITEKFDTRPEWIDEMTFQFYALAKDAKTGEYSLYKNSVRYVDIEKGRDHMATMYVRPTAVKRYGQLVAVAVEVSVAGKVIKEDYETNPELKIAKDWWKKEWKGVVAREGCMVDRSQSPFAFINIDDNEVIR